MFSTHEEKTYQNSLGLGEDNSGTEMPVKKSNKIYTFRLLESAKKLIISSIDRATFSCSGANVRLLQDSSRLDFHDLATTTSAVRLLLLGSFFLHVVRANTSESHCIAQNLASN